MGNFLLKHKKRSFYKEIKKFLKKNNACYILLRCSDPNMDGSMEVDMSYDGDKVLAAYLLENAIDVLEGIEINKKL